MPNMKEKVQQPCSSPKSSLEKRMAYYCTLFNEFNESKSHQEAQWKETPIIRDNHIKVRA